MFQPFEEFRSIYIHKLIELKKRYLVAQSYKRARDPCADQHRIDIILTDYDSLGGANIHLNAVKQDKYAAILDLEKPAHRNKLSEMLAAGSGYRLFWAIVKSKKDVQERINRRYKDNMRRYIEKNTRWRIGGGETIFPNVDVTFGELFITLKYGGQTLRIKFEEIERI
jgi:hypothetical protein